MGMRSVWLIEDNEAFRQAALFALDTQPEYSWKGFIRCEDALKELKQASPPDIILLDVDLPGMNGIEGIQRFRELLPDIPILMLTVYEEDDKIFGAICAGASGYLLKSESFKNILAAVEQVVDGGAPMTPQIAKRVIGMFAKKIPVKKDYGLSPRESDVLVLMAEGLGRKQIADRLDLSPHTVCNITRGVYRKLHVNCQSAAVSLAIRDGLVDR